MIKTRIFCFVVISFLFYSTSSITAPCKLRATKYGSVCVCNADYCDYMDEPRLQNNDSLFVVSSSMQGLRFVLTEGLSFGSQEKLIVQDYTESSSRDDFEQSALVIESDGKLLRMDGGNGKKAKFFRNSRTTIVSVDRRIFYQKIVGFGGAFTGAVSYLLNQLSPELQDHIYRSYFATSGIQYNMLRMSIGGCDFDLAPWAYNEQPRDDPKLTNFTKLDPRDVQKVQQMQRLKEVTKVSGVKIMAAAWSPPKWMKTNDEWTGPSLLKRQYYQAWADYHLRFLELVAAKNMPIWAISTGNEPLNGVIAWFFVRFMSMGWTPSTQAIWLAEHLGPTIKNSKHKDVLIFGNDDQRFTFPGWFRKMNRTHKNSLDYLDGLAVHWYWDELLPPSFIDAAHKEMPEKLLVNTESSIGDKPWQTHGPELGSWSRGEQYIRDLIENMQHSYNGYIDWNIVLNEQGGPNYVNNFVDSAVIINETSREEFYKQPIFYSMGHLSKFVPPDSVRISTQSSNDALITVGFQRPDGSIAVILFNSDSGAMDVSLSDSVRGEIAVNVPAHSIHTFVYN